MISVVEIPPQPRDDAWWLERHLRNWVTYMHTGARPKGLPAKASGGATNYTSLDLENVSAYEHLDRDLAERTNAIIEDLAPVERCAIYHCYLHAVYRFPREDFDVILERARQNIAKGLKRRGVWLGE